MRTIPPRVKGLFFGAVTNISNEITSPIRLQGEQCAHTREWNRKKRPEDFPSAAGTWPAALWEVISEGGMGTPRCWWPSEVVMVPE